LEHTERIPIGQPGTGVEMTRYSEDATMKTCTTCGNEIESSVRRCPYCERPQAGGSVAQTQRAHLTVVTVNLKEGLPVVEEALQRMTRKLYESRLQGTKLVRLVHGYGSTGSGGAIKLAVRRELETARRDGAIKDYVSGEDYQHSDAGRKLRSRFPQLKATVRTDQQNPGITFVAL